MRRTIVIMTIALLALLCSCSTKSRVNPVAGLANPWKEVEAETITEKTGFCTSIPENASDIAYRWNETTSLAQVDFVKDGIRWTARIQKSKEFCDISGMYYQWEEENRLPGSKDMTQTVKTATDKMNGQERKVICILRHDGKTGLMTSLSCIAEKSFSMESALEIFNGLFN